MSFLAVLFALLFEQVKPLPRSNFIHSGLTAWMRWVGHNFNAGRDAHAAVVWAITVPLPAFAAWGVHVGLAQIGWPFALAWDVLVLYLTLGFRQFSHFFTDIQDALERVLDSTPATCRATSCFATSSSTPWCRRIAMCSACSSGS
jgi:adenosylcobinamide-phosphate synthase